MSESNKAKDIKNNENMTKSKAKRVARKEAAEKAKKQAIRENIIGNAMIVIFVAIIVCIVGAMVAKSLKKVTPSDNYSACLEANGYIKNTGAADIELPEYKNITVPLAEVEYTEDELNSAIDSLLNANKVMNDDSSLKVADGDEVNIDYVGTIDGVEFDGGSSEDYNLTIGSGSFIEGFEEQLIGTSVSDTVKINVTFPDDYDNEELAGKDAEFTVTINGINELPEFNDEFVAEHLSDVASTAEEYKQYLKDSNLDTNLTNWITDYLEGNATVNKFDKKYIKNLKSTIKYDDLQNYEYMAEMYKSYLGYSYYNSFNDYTGKTDAEYDESLVDTAKNVYKNNLLYQSILEREGVTVDAAYAKEVLAKQGSDESVYDSQVESYGEPYVLQMYMRDKAIELVKANATVQ